MKVGLAAGRYSGKSLPDLYRTPQALQRVFDPIGPALHCGVLVISQCIRFLTDCEDGELWFPVPASKWSERKGQFDFLVFGILYSRRITVLRHFDQRLGLAKFSASDGAFGASCNC